jgi:hypothetical protein
MEFLENKKYRKIKYDPKNINGWNYNQFYYWSITKPERTKKIAEKNLFKYGGVPYYERKLNMARAYAIKNKELLRKKYLERMQKIKADPILLQELREKQKKYSLANYAKNKEKIKERARKYYWRVKRNKLKSVEL